MRRPDRPSERPDVIDLNARRRVAELQKQARKAGGGPPNRPRPTGALGAWGILLLAAFLWALLRWLQA